MNQSEQLQHETIKTLLKQSVQNNTNLTFVQKQNACDKIDRAAQQAEWIMDILKICGYI